MTSEQFVQYLIDGITSGSIYAIVALGFTIIYSVTNIINFAQGEFVMMGGMISYMLVRSMEVPTFPTIIIALLVAASIGLLIYSMLKRPFKIVLALPLVLVTLGSIPLTLYGFRALASAELPVLAAALVSVLFVAFAGIVMYFLALRPARKASTVSLIIITIGAAIFIRGIAGELWGVDAVRPPVFSGKQSIEILGGYIHPQALWIVGAALISTIILHLFFSYTMIGKALKACAISPVAAGMVGINAKTMALIAFALAAALGAIGGVAMAPKSLMAYNDGFMLGLYGFIAASIGGFKSQIAAVIGGFMLGIVMSLVVGIDWWIFTSTYKDVIAVGVLLLVLIVRSSRLAAEERAS